MSLPILASRRYLPVAMMALSGLLFQVPTFAAGNGASVFDEECSDCHSVTPGKNKKGPSLFGVVGRKPATIEGFNYSDAMRANLETWTVDRLNPYITAPKRIVPGGKMKYDGLSDAKERADLIAYLEGLH